MISLRLALMLVVGGKIVGYERFRVFVCVPSLTYIDSHCTFGVKMK